MLPKTEERHEGECLDPGIRWWIELRGVLGITSERQVHIWTAVGKLLAVDLQHESAPGNCRALRETCQRREDQPPRTRTPSEPQISFTAEAFR